MVNLGNDLVVFKQIITRTKQKYFVESGYKQYVYFYKFAVETNKNWSLLKKNN